MVNDYDEMRHMSQQLARIAAGASNIDYGIKIMVFLLILILWRVW